MKSNLLVAIAGVMLLGVTQASAAILDVKYTGTVTYGYDQTGVFGTVETDGNAYVGDAFVANFVFNTNIYGSAVSGPLENNALGGSSVSGSGSPALSASLTLNGQTASIGDPGYYGYIAGYNDGFSQSEQQHAAGNFSYDSLSALIYAFDASIPNSITTPFTYNVASDPDNAFGSMGFVLGTSDTTYAQILGTANILTVSLATTPLPSTWTMLIAGFAGLGFFAYRGTKKSGTAVAAA
jgi:hypothetical protein